jgi:hypothetical protein
MTRKTRFVAAALLVGVLATIAIATGAAGSTRHTGPANEVNVALTPSSPQLATCMPDAQLNVNVHEGGDEKGADELEISGHNLPPDRDFTVFLLQQAGTPFGAAEYIGDFSSDHGGNAHNNLRLIVDEAFSSTIVNGARVRVDLNRIGVWFADPAEDDFCFGPNGGSVTPFDGDNNAGVQAFNSANADPLPAP